jgi:hypothetical protein
VNLTNLTQSRKLKEWGAPQIINFFYFGTKIEYVEDVTDVYRMGIPGDEVVAAYDLESLIGWLDDIEEIYHDPKGEGYKAISWQGIDTGYYKTPLEAVYKLAEAIHGKEAYNG